MSLPRFAPVRAGGMVLSAVVFALALTGCGSSHTVAAEMPAVAASSVPHSREANDVARFLSGLPGAEGSPFVALEESETWKEHRRQLDAAWAGASAELLPGLRKFQADELSARELTSRTVFYPFSGPDSLMVTTYFPHNPVYVMAALEPAGTLPTVESITKHNLAVYLAAMRDTTASELGRSFFVTRQMDSQFRGQITDGLLVPILQLLARSGHTILGFRYVRLNEKAEVVERAKDYKAATRYGNKGVEIEFRTEADASVHLLDYFSVNLSNDRLKENTPFQMYMSRLTGVVSMLKATSYMPHQPGFSMIRDALLANSFALLQDDSGLPYRAFKADVWKVQLYGDYQQPYGSFRFLEQADLRAAYQSKSPKPLPMHVGYGYKRITSNLLLATRAQ